MFATPILYIVFNRLDTVKQTFPQIKKQQPKELYIAADGPRPSKPEEFEKCQAVRNWILSQIDWDCNVHTLFREKNLGCKYGVGGAIKWFFENVEQGIVLEDDILPANSFFHYCELMLNTYKGSSNIGFITGCCFPLFLKKKSVDYFLSTITNVWGWASWEEVVKLYNPDYASLQNSRLKDVNTIFLSKKAKSELLKYSLRAAAGKIDTWDYQMNDYMASHGRYTITPSIPLVRNIGFIKDSTHTPEAPAWYMDFLEEHNFVVQKSVKLDKCYSREYEETNVRSIFQLILSRFWEIEYIVTRKLKIK